MRTLTLLSILGWSLGSGCRGTATPTRAPSVTPQPSPYAGEPLVPTATVAPREMAPVAGPAATVSVSPGAEETAARTVPVNRDRFGAGVALALITDYPVERLNIGWYLNWGVRLNPAQPGGASFWQMVRVSEEGFLPDAATIRAAAIANPGSFWLVGNEPDVRWQDNTTPEQYAVRYHDLYGILKSADSTCQVAIGGVSQPTPLRLAYLDRVLASYESRYAEPMPVDVWNVHNFILREELDSWGVGIPPGIDVEAGTLYEIEDHDDVAIFREQLIAFRRWMNEHGERDKPLVVSEYGILMPADYGFGPGRVRRFLEATFDLFLTATDDAIGYPEDDNRLVQWWCWYSLAAPHDYYPTGNLFDPETKELTPLGAAFAAYKGP